MAYDPMTGEPIDLALQERSSEKARDKKRRVYIGITAAVLVTAFLAVASSSGLFHKRSERVMRAVAGTFEDAPQFVRDLQPFSLLAGDRYTVSFSCELKDMDMEMSGEVRISGREKQVSAQLGCGGTELKVLGGIHGDTLKLQIPSLSRYVLTYHFDGKNTGYIADELEDEAEILDAVMGTLSESSSEARSVQKELLKVFMDEWDTFEFTDAKKKDHTIDDKDVSCKGYHTTVTGDNIVHIVDGVEDVLYDRYAVFFEEDIFGMEDLEDALDKIRDSAGQMDDIELTFYIYQDKLASVIVRMTDDEVQLCFEGGDYRMQHMTLKMDGSRLQLAGRKSGPREIFTVKERHGRQSGEIATLKYNQENGRFSLDLYDGSSGLKGRLAREGSELTLKIREIYGASASVSPDIELALKKGAKLEKYSGKEFDLGNADKRELTDLASDMEDELYGTDLWYLWEELLYRYGQ